MTASTIDATPQEQAIALDALSATVADVRRLAGAGHLPECERRLDAHLRSLRALLGPAQATLAEDVVDLAKRALDAADPAAPLLMLQMAEDRLRTAVSRGQPLVARAA